MAIVRGERAILELAVRRLLESLADPDPYVRCGAVYGLAEAQCRAPEFLAALASMRGDPDELVREAAEYARETIAKPPEAAPAAEESGAAAETHP